MLILSVMRPTLPRLSPHPAVPPSCHRTGAGVAGSISASGAWSRLAVHLATGVASGLAHVHAHHVVHGDLSAANILLVWSGGPSGIGEGRNGAPECGL